VTRESFGSVSWTAAALGDSDTNEFAEVTDAAATGVATVDWFGVTDVAALSPDSGAAAVTEEVVPGEAAGATDTSTTGVRVTALASGADETVWLITAWSFSASGSGEAVMETLTLVADSAGR
jgi:hypothetical protein